LPIFLEETLSNESKKISFQVPQYNAAGQHVSNTSKSLNVKIPAGVSDGERIRLKGQGAPGVGGGANGDLYLTIRFAPHPKFDVEGDNLIITLPLAPWELALGTEVAVPTLTGKINLKVPAGSQNGQRMRAKGHGLLNKAGERGYLFVQLKVVMPKAADDEVKALWQELAKKAAFNPREKTSESDDGVAPMSNPLIVQLDMAEFCEATDLSDVYVIEIVEHGILEPQGRQPEDWRFTDYELALAKRAAKLRHDLELEWEGVALALDLLEEVQQLRAENQMLRQRLGRLVVE
jgi:hypothetical protein